MSAVPAANDPNCAVSIDRTSGVGATEYKIRGDLDGVQRAIKAIFLDYHPLAYGTRVHALDQGYDGVWEARMSRMNSCE